MKKLLMVLMLFTFKLKAQTMTYDGITIEIQNKHDTLAYNFDEKGYITFKGEAIYLGDKIYYYSNEVAVCSYDSCCEYEIFDVKLCNDDGTYDYGYKLFIEYKDNRMQNLYIRKKRKYTWYENIQNEEVERKLIY